MKTHSAYLIDLEFSPNDNPSKKELKSRERQISLREHPDRGGNEEKFRAAREAYVALTENKYLDDDYDPQEEVSPEDLKSYVADRITSFMDNICHPIEKNKIKLIGNKIVYIKNENEEEKIIKIGNQIFKTKGNNEGEDNE